MTLMIPTARMLLALALLMSPAAAAEPIRHIGIHVQPYYAAAETPDAPPMVDVGASFSGLLASTKRDDILAARDKVVAGPKMVTPLTMMVLAIRLYDAGLRDDSVLWFYAARDRYITLSEVIDVGAAGLAEVEAAIGSFAALAGPFINGYAFCDVANQAKRRADALAWVEANPYGVIFLSQLPARSGDRAALLDQSIAGLKANAAKERAFLEDPANLAGFKATRQQNEMDERFCWQ
jgi:hypothetical protein